MFAIDDLAVPLLAAPMAGGVSTPALVAAAERAGGLGFLAAGYQSTDSLVAQVAQTRALGVARFGVNLFVPETAPEDLLQAEEYRRALQPVAVEYGIELPEPRHDDDEWERKIGALLDHPVPAVSFTFGCPDPALIGRLHDVGTGVLVTVTSAVDARTASMAGADALVVQGPEAGGHRSTFRCLDEPPAQPLQHLLTEILGVTNRPLVAAGGLCTPAAVADALRTADAVQVGTALLDADEAGTTATYRAALHDPFFTRTAVTRAFSGRPARGLENEFMRDFTDLAPAAYPALHHLTSPIRRAAAQAGHPGRLALWAGSGWQAVRRGPAQRLLSDLLGGAGR